MRSTETGSLKRIHQLKTHTKKINERLKIDFCLHERFLYVAVIRLEIIVMHNSRARLIRSVPRGLCEHCKTLLHIQKKWLLLLYCVFQLPYQGQT